VRTLDDRDTALLNEAMSEPQLAERRRSWVEHGCRFLISGKVAFVM
jgi:hypothetical protein